MKALVYEAPWRLVLRDVPEPAAAAGDVVVAVRAAGVCGSDVHGFTGSTGRRIPPLVMGHEVAGVVRDVGEEVTGVRPDDRVAVRSIDSCGACRECRSGRTGICRNRRGLGVTMPGGYAERVVVPSRMVVPLPDSVEFEEGALAEPLSVAMHAVKLTPIGLMDRVAILGAGPIGLLALLAARSAGAGTTIVIDRVPRRLALARELGADVLVDAGRSDPADAVREATGGEMADAVIEAVGLDVTARQSVGLVRAGGNVTWIGNSERTVSLDMQDVVTREVTIRGSYGSGDEFEAAIEAIATGRIAVHLLVDRVAPLGQGADLIGALATGQLDATKVVLLPHED